MAEIRDKGLRLGAKTTKLVAPATPAEFEKPLAAKAFPIKDAIRRLTDPGAALKKAAAAPDLEFSEVSAGKTAALVAKADLFDAMPGTLAFAKPAPGFKTIPAGILKKPFAMKALMPFLLRGDLFNFVAGFKEAYDKLTPEQKAKYDAIAKSLGNDPAARRALALMLVNGALESRDLKGGGTLLDHLGTLATEPVAEGVDRRKLLADVIRDISDPSQISQGNYNTCAAATAQRLLAGQSPAEYARLMAGLASPAGEVKLANGDTLERPADWNQSSGDGRDLAGRMFQSSLMSYAAGKNGETYSNVTDQRTKKNGTKKSGLNAVEVVYLFEGILGKDYNKYSKSEIGADALMQKIKDVVAKGGVVPCAITEDGRNHEVLVTKIENGQVHYYDPRSGQTKTMSEADFKAKLFNANIPNPTVLAFRISALAKMSKLAGRNDVMDLGLRGRAGFFDDLRGPGGTAGTRGGASKAASDGDGPAEAGTAGKTPKRGGLFGFGGLANLVKLLVLMGAADEEIGDGSGSGNQTSGRDSGTSSSSSRGSRGRGGRTGNSSGG